ncbi:BLUF domain-containing protein [Hymenobacter caeli]|uniref:BLUF domain-containing protein n=1 Tax=Hymenobacter caeli TaxID=2735894 RepID=A0ABX2FVD6_9BACT|nr:BLUF domain-containing protein [Hymenobacter caeli]NRT21173.1 hypothetical protein [Hymenobacter caeli]
MTADPHQDEATRRRAVAWVVALTAGTVLAPRHYERELLRSYRHGGITINEMSDLLDASTYQLLYSSQATPPPTETQLQELLHRARDYNARHQITGLLLYSDGRFVQVLEGPEAQLRALYARIQLDPRHAQVLTLGHGPGPRRRFAEFSMAFGHVGPAALDEALDAVAARGPLVLADPRLQILLEIFGLPEPDLS